MKETSIPKARPDRKLVQVNLGCGTNIADGFINVDNFELSSEKSFIKANIIDGLPFENESVDYIICDQVIEHIAMKDIPTVLYNIRRVLKKGGKAIIIVPDFEGAVRQWLDARLNESFDPVQYQWFSEVVYGNQNHDGEFHKAPMSPSYLHYLLNMSGLSKNTISFWPAFGEVPKFPGVRKSGDNARLRNAQLVAEITKE